MFRRDDPITRWLLLVTSALLGFKAMSAMRAVVAGIVVALEEETAPGIGLVLVVRMLAIAVGTEFGTGPAAPWLVVKITGGMLEFEVAGSWMGSELVSWRESALKAIWSGLS